MKDLAADKSSLFPVVEATPLKVACRLGHAKVVKLLIDFARKNRIEDQIRKNDLLLIAATYNNPDVAALLLRLDDAPVALSNETPYLNYAILWADQQKDFGLIKQFSAHGILQTKATRDEMKPLRYSAFSSNNKPKNISVIQIFYSFHFNEFLTKYMYGFSDGKVNFRVFFL